MDYKKMKKQIISLCGGTGNILGVTHCATRLRLTLKDDSQFNEEELKKVEGIVNTLKIGGQCQIVIGTHVAELYQEFSGDASTEGYAAKGKQITVKDIFQTFFSFIGASVGFYIVPLIGGGLIKALLTVLLQLGLMSAESNTYTVLWFAADAVFQFLPILVAIGVARKLKANEALAVYTAAIMISPAFISAVNEGASLSVFGLPIQPISYYGSFLPAVATVVVMAYLERLLKKVIPTAAQQLLVPFLTILIMTPVALCVTGPLAQLFSNILAKPLIALSDHAWIVVTILGFIMPIMIMFGLHSAIFVFSITMFLSVFGYDPLFMPASFCSHIAMGAVALAVFLKSKKAAIKTTAISSCGTVWLGSISEPVIFGVLAQNRICMVAACIAGGISSLVGGLLGLKCYAVAGSGLFHIPTFLGPESNIFVVLLCTVISIVGGFVITFLKYKDPVEE